MKVDRGDDLNQIVFEYYEERVPETYPGQNYVSSDGLIRRRYVLHLVRAYHTKALMARIFGRSEYLGPSPHVAEYRFREDLGEVLIEWWDAYLKVKFDNG